MQLFIRGSEQSRFEVTEDGRVGDLKAHINGVDGFACEDQIILYAGKPLEDEVMLSSFEDMSTLDVEVRMLGGKVHGSLARAGKVKGQTPKVDKQDKKKNKRGRAKRRMQYNRRYGVVVSTFGRRKGPNANS